MGLKSHTVFKMQVTWPYPGRWIERGAEDGALIACARGPPDMITNTCLIEGVITVQIKSGGEHSDR